MTNRSPTAASLGGRVVVIDCADLDEAIAIAAGHRYARWGCVEIRPVWE